MSRRGPTRPFALLHVHTVGLSLFLVTFPYTATILQGPARFLTRLHTTTIDRSFPQAGDTTHRYSTEHTAAPQATHTLRPVFPKRVHYRIPDGTTLKPHATTSNLTHCWLVSNLMITPRSSPISSLVPGCNPPKATGLVLAETGSLVPTCTCAN